MGFQLLEKHVRATWRMLSHPGTLLQVRCIPGGADGALISNEEDFVRWARLHNGMGELYVGRNPRTHSGSVALVRCVSFDFDCIHADGERPTDGQMEVCRRAVDSVLARYPGGVCAFTGNGLRLFYVAVHPVETDLDSFARSYRRFNREVLGAVTSGSKDRPLKETILEGFYGQVRLDDLHDHARLDRILGVVSVKAEPRLTKFLNLPSTSPNGGEIFRAISAFGSGESTHQGNVLAESNGGNSRPGNSNVVLNKKGSPSVPLITHPERQRYLLGIAGALRRRAQDEESIYQAVKNAYEKNCSHEPPKSDEKLKDIARSVMKYEPGEITNRELYRGVDQPDHHSDGVAGILLATPGDTLDEYDAILSKRSQFTEPELATGFKHIDDLTDGYIRGDLFTLGANTGAGKSSLFVCSANALCRKGKKVLYLSTELSRWQVYDKLFSLNTGIEYRKFRKGWLSPEEMEQKNQFSKEFRSYPLIVNDLLSPEIDQVRDMVKRERPDVLFFDHLHQVGAGAVNLYGVLSRFTNDLKALSSDFNVAVAAAAQFGRPERMMDKDTGEMKIAKKPTLYDFKSCGEIENRSATALLMSDTRESVDLDTNIMNVDIAKCRHGERGTVRLAWHWKISKFSELEGA